MTSGEDPFDFDEDRTVIQRPNPGGRRNPAQSPPTADQNASMGNNADADRNDQPERTAILGGAAHPDNARPGQRRKSALAGAVAAQNVTVDALGSSEMDGANPLVASGAKLLALAGALRNTIRHDDIGALRARIVDELGVYEETARTRGADPKEVQLGHYVLCALIDDVVMATPWGGQKVWSKRSLTSAFHHQVDSGDKLLELANRLEQSPGQHPNVLELVYAAMSLGFEGRLRLDERGIAQHTKVRGALFRALRERRGGYERSLSRMWRGADTGYKPLVRRIPPWMFWSAFALFGFAFFSLLYFLLNAQTERAVTRLADADAPTLAAPVQVYTPPVIEDDRFDRIVEILKPDIDAGRVVVANHPNQIDIRIATTQASEVFASAQASLRSTYSDTITRIGEASELTDDAVFIRGYTDGQPIKTQRYQSNWELSTARAETVQRMLASTASNPDRFSAEGRGPEDPIGDNTTVEGRRENRRVEITLQKAAGVTYAGQ